MYEISLFNTPNMTWVLKERDCIKLYAFRDYLILPNQVVTIRFGNFRYSCSKDVIGIPYIPNKDAKYSLYHPEGTHNWRGSKSATVVVTNYNEEPVTIVSGSHICNINLMTIQYFNLMRKHNNSDKGLASRYVNIVLLND